MVGRHEPLAIPVDDGRGICGTVLDDGGRVQVLQIYESCRLNAGRPGQHLPWCAGLQGATLVEQAHAISQARRLVEVMGHQHDGNPELPAQLCQLPVQPPACHPVDGRERLIEQQYPGVPGERPGNRHPLLLPARELGRAALLQAVQVHQRQQLSGPAVAERCAQMAESGAHVAEHGHVREKRIALEDQAHGTLPGRYIDPAG